MKKTCSEWQMVRTARGNEKRCVRFSETQDAAMHRGGFGNALVPPMFSVPIDGKKLAIGAGVGLGGLLLAKFLISKYGLGKVPEWLLKFIPVLAGGVAGAGLWYGFRKKNPTLAASLALGAVAVPIGVNLIDFARSKWTMFSDLVAVETPYGMYINDPVGRTFPALHQQGGMYLNANNAAQGGSYQGLNDYVPTGQQYENPLQELYAHS